MMATKEATQVQPTTPEQYVHPPWYGNNEVARLPKWETVTFHMDDRSGVPAMSPQDMEIKGAPGEGAMMDGTRAGVSHSVKVHFERIPRGVCPMTYDQVREIFQKSMTEKITLAEATFQVVGEGEFAQKVLTRHRSPDAPNTRAWYPGCEDNKPVPPVAGPRPLVPGRRVTQP